MTRNAWVRGTRPLSVAHRGHSIAFPENTLVAYRQAIAMGVEMIECDVAVTRDGQLVMIHDGTLDRTTNGHGPVNGATWDEIRGLDAGASFDPVFAGTRIPSTEETILLFKESGILSCFEVKGGSTEEAGRIALGLLELLRKHDMLGTAFMSSYNHEALKVALRRCPELLVAPERLPDDSPPDPPEALRQAKSLNAPVLQHQSTVLSAEVVGLLHENDVAVWSWLVPDKHSLLLSLELGVDAVMADDVRLLLDMLDREWSAR